MPNPIPNVTSISPAFGIPGEFGFIMTVNGSNFISTSVVNYNGQPRQTTYVSATKLFSTVLQSDLLIVGTIPINVVNPAPGGGGLEVYRLP